MHFVALMRQLEYRQAQVPHDQAWPSGLISTSGAN
jgi:hypothetical protein